jgi:NADH dehydrogenase FAD-containing subunit
MLLLKFKLIFRSVSEAFDSNSIDIDFSIVITTINEDIITNSDRVISLMKSQWVAQVSNLAHDSGLSLGVHDHPRCVSVFIHVPDFPNQEVFVLGDRHLFQS